MKPEQASPVSQVLVARASLDDLDRIVSLHLECLGPRANLASLLGPTFVRAAYQWFLTSEETHVIKATVADEIAGFTSICEVPYTVPMVVACRREALRCLLLRPWLLFNPRVLRRAWWRPAGTGSKMSGPGIAQVGFTAVSPRYRGRGVGSCLKAASIQTCRRLGVRGVVTGVSRENRASIALNERFGFEEIEEAATPRFRYYLLRLAAEPEGVDEGVITAGPAGVPPNLTAQGS